MRKNGAITIKSEWSEFLAELDVKIMIGGFAQEIVNWQPLDSFFREMPFYRLYLPTKGEFCISSVYSIESTTLIRPGTVYLIPDCLVLKYQGIAPSDHYWIHFFSRQMQKLEEEIGKPLFVRGSRRVTLTETGILLRKRAEEIVHLCEKTVY